MFKLPELSHPVIKTSHSFCCYLPFAKFLNKQTRKFIYFARVRPKYSNKTSLFILWLKYLTPSSSIASHLFHHKALFLRLTLKNSTVNVWEKSSFSILFQYISVPYSSNCTFLDIYLNQRLIFYPKNSRSSLCSPFNLSKTACKFIKPASRNLKHLNTYLTSSCMPKNYSAKFSLSSFKLINPHKPLLKYLNPPSSVSFHLITIH